MKKIIIVLFLISIQNTYSQDFKYSRIDSTIFNAMRDEMKRSMSDYKHPEAGKFFYIMYQIDDGKSLFSSATLGSMIISSIDDIRSDSYRIMLGDYNFNDENFLSLSGEPDLSTNNVISVPLGDDYWGIRRALWSFTESAFKNCVKSYLGKKHFYAENPLKKPTIPDFLKVDSVKYLKNSNVKLDQGKADNYVRKISSVFKNYKEITESSVVFNQIKLNVYLLSTEGTICKIPLDFSMISINAGISNDSIEDKSVNERISFFEKDPENLYSNIDKISSSAKKLAEYLITINKANDLKENYNGPVILDDLASSEFFYKTMFSGNLSLCAQREQISDNARYNSQFQKKLSIEDKLGKKVAPVEFSVIDKPKLEQFENKNLLGTTCIDQEGVVPPDEIVLIENGELKNLLSTRVPTTATSVSNGHRRFGVSTRGSIVSVLPSNLFVNYSNGKEKNVLKEKLIELCKENGLEYGIEIRPLDAAADDSPYVFYKIGLDGNEELIKPMIFPSVDFKTLNKVVGCTSQKYISNSLLNYGMPNNLGSGLNLGGLSGCFVSVIAPSSVLLKDIQVRINSYYGGGYSE